jgi:dTDP-4-amino-4,6-dideoxygalactose transaminase
MVVTSNPEYANTVRMLRDWGQSRRYYHDLPGFNYRMDGIQGAILRVKLRYLEQWTEARRAVAATYSKLLAGADVMLPIEMAYARHVYHAYVIRSAVRDDLAAELKDKGIQTGIHYPIPVHLQKAYVDPAYGKGSFPNAERVAAEVLSLPIYPELTSSQVELVCESIRNYVQASLSRR